MKIRTNCALTISGLSLLCLTTFGCTPSSGSDALQATGEGGQSKTHHHPVNRNGSYVAAVVDAQVDFPASSPIGQAQISGKLWLTVRDPNGDIEHPRAQDKFIAYFDVSRIRSSNSNSNRQISYRETALVLSENLSADAQAALTKCKDVAKCFYAVEEVRGNVRPDAILFDSATGKIVWAQMSGYPVSLAEASARYFEKTRVCDGLASGFDASSVRRGPMSLNFASSGAHLRQGDKAVFLFDKGSTCFRKEVTLSTLDTYRCGDQFPVLGFGGENLGVTVKGDEFRLVGITEVTPAEGTDSSNRGAADYACGSTDIFSF